MRHRFALPILVAFVVAACGPKTPPADEGTEPISVLELATAAPAAGAASTAVATAAPGTGGFFFGDFHLVERGVLDGDTILVKGLDASLRLIGIDTEEKYKHEADRRAAAADFAAFAKEKRGKSPTPVKFATPMGEEATRFAEDFFAGHATVRLEYDGLGRKIGYYGRHLVHVFANKEGRWVHYNVAAVRAGMSPYFVKYGRSARFHEAFTAAQEEARAAKRGIWAPGAPAYPDYDERLEWWNRRADEIERFAENFAGEPGYVDLGDADALDQLTAAAGSVVTVFGTVGKPLVERTPYLVPLSHRNKNDFMIVCFNDEELSKIEPDRWRRDYVYVRGKVSVYRGRPQLKAADVERIWIE